MIPNFNELGDARLVDLISKVAKTSQKQTARVLVALSMIERTFGVGAPKIVRYELETLRKPTANNVAGCEQAYSHLRKDADNDALFDQIREYR